MTNRNYHIAVALVALSALSCGGDAVPETIDREIFVQAYASLRIAAVETDSGRIAAQARDSILEVYGVSEQELTTFATVHAADLTFMRDVWNEVELLMDRGAEGN